MVEGQIINVRERYCIVLPNRVELYKKEVQQLAETLAETNAFEAIKKFGRQVEARERSTSSSEEYDTSDNSSSSTH